MDINMTWDEIFKDKKVKWKKYRICCYKENRCFRDYDRLFYVNARCDAEAADYCDEYRNSHQQYDRVTYTYTPAGCE